MNQPAEQVAIDFSTEPSPPRKGSNTLRVKLTSAEGKPITAAQVTVTFYMPPCRRWEWRPSRRSSTLAGKGDGTYEGSLELPSGGSYQVTIVALSNGQTIASKQLTVNATGGM